MKTWMYARANMKQGMAQQEQTSRTNQLRPETRRRGLGMVSPPPPGAMSPSIKNVDYKDRIAWRMYGSLIRYYYLQCQTVTSWGSSWCNSQVLILPNQVILETRRVKTRWERVSSRWRDAFATVVVSVSGQWDAFEVLRAVRDRWRKWNDASQRGELIKTIAIGEGKTGWWCNGWRGLYHIGLEGWMVAGQVTL